MPLLTPIASTIKNQSDLFGRDKPIQITITLAISKTNKNQRQFCIPIKNSLLCVLIFHDRCAVLLTGCQNFQEFFGKVR
jgi:hypothetical protein